MKFERKKLKDGSVEYSVSGELKSYYSDPLMDVINNDVESGAVTSFSFDFSNVEYIDSQGIRLLVVAGKYNYKGDKNLIIKNASDKTKRILNLAEIRFIEFGD